MAIDFEVAAVRVHFRILDETYVAYWKCGISTEVLRTSGTEIAGLRCSHHTWKLPNCVVPIVRSLEVACCPLFTNSLLPSMVSTKDGSRCEREVRPCSDCNFDVALEEPIAAESTCRCRSEC